MSTASKGKGGFHYLVSEPARACVIAGHPVWPFAGPDVIAGHPVWPFAGPDVIAGHPVWPFAGPDLFVATAAGRHAGFVVSRAADAAGPSVTENTLNQIRNQAVTVKM